MAIGKGFSVLFCSLVLFSAVVRSESVPGMLARVGGVEVSGERLLELQKVKTSLLPFARLPLSVARPRVVLVDAGDQVFAYAHVVPRPTISVSLAAFELCADKRVGEQVSACLAFIIGHELEHLRVGDTNNVHGLSALAGDAATQNVELSADRSGLYLASLGGYRVELLFTKNGGDPVLRTLFGAGDMARNRSHPRVMARYENAQQALGAVVDSLPLFEFGTAMAMLGRCDEAVALLEQFSNSLPSAEVLNNIGACQLKLSLQNAVPVGPYSFWLLTELHTNVEAVSRWSNTRSGYNEERASRYLLQALDTLKRAYEAYPKDMNVTLNYANALFLSRNYGLCQLIVEGSMDGDVRGNQLAQLSFLARAMSAGTSKAKVAAATAIGELGKSAEGNHQFTFNKRVLAEGTDNLEPSYPASILAGLNVSAMPLYLREKFGKPLDKYPEAVGVVHSLGLANGRTIAASFKKIQKLSKKRRKADNVTVRSVGNDSRRSLYSDEMNSLSVLYFRTTPLLLRLTDLSKSDLLDLQKNCSAALLVHSTSNSPPTGYSCGEEWSLTMSPNDRWSLWLQP